MYFLRQNPREKHPKLSMWQKLRRFLKIILSFLLFILAGCPCKEFDCSVLDDFAESCKEPNYNDNYQRCAQVQKNEFDECVDNCDGPTCSEKCGSEYIQAIRNCPCAQNCPCKCDSYLSRLNVI